MERSDILDSHVHASPDHLHAADVDVESLIQEYINGGEVRPLWQLAQDVQGSALMYANVIEQLKSGASPKHIKAHFTHLRAVSEELPNPAGERMLTFCLNKLNGYRECLLALATRHGQQLLAEMGANGLSAGLTVCLGLPPSIELQILYTPKP
jgi:hypothetical protein